MSGIKTYNPSPADASSLAFSCEENTKDLFDVRKRPISGAIFFRGKKRFKSRLARGESEKENVTVSG